MQMYLEAAGPGFEFRSGVSHPEFKSSATLVNSQLVASYQLRFRGAERTSLRTEKATPRTGDRGTEERKTGIAEAL